MSLQQHKRHKRISTHKQMSETRRTSKAVVLLKSQSTLDSSSVFDQNSLSTSKREASLRTSPTQSIFSLPSSSTKRCLNDEENPATSQQSSSSSSSFSSSSSSNLSHSYSKSISDRFTCTNPFKSEQCSQRSDGCKREKAIPFPHSSVTITHSSELTMAKSSLDTSSVISSTFCKPNISNDITDTAFLDRKSKCVPCEESITLEKQSGQMDKPAVTSTSTTISSSRFNAPSPLTSNTLIDVNSIENGFNSDELSCTYRHNSEYIKKMRLIKSLVQ